MLTSDQAREIVARIINSQGATVINTADPAFELFTGLLHALDFVVPGAGSTAERVLGAITGRSLTVPGPLGPLVVLSHEAGEPVAQVCAAAQQAVFAAQMKRAGQVQTWADFIGEGELRALRIGHALCAGAFAFYLLTGQRPNFDELGRLGRELAAPLPLSDADAATLRMVLVSQLSGLDDGERPSVAAAGVLLAQLRELAPGAIVPEGWAS